MPDCSRQSPHWDGLAQGFSPIFSVIACKGTQPPYTCPGLDTVPPGCAVIAPPRDDLYQVLSPLFQVLPYEGFQPRYICPETDNLPPDRSA